jgi:inward rectifier potassium channel
MPKSVTVRAGQVEFLKLNVDKHDWRDAYHWLLALRWPQFAAFVAGVYVALNLFFAMLYRLGGNSIAGMASDSFLEAFFFSVQTLATVGYGHMYPSNVYGHIVTTIEIMCGMFLLAVMTGLIFVRFSRPTARILFSNTMVICPFNGQPTLMLRVANLRHHSMVEAEFRVAFTRDETTLEGETVRRFYPLKLDFDRLSIFPVALTLRHFIDQQSPLYGATPESLRACDAFLLTSIVCVETVIPAAVQMQHDYTWRDIRFGERFVEIYNDLEDGRLSVDYGRIHETEPAPVVSAAR